MISAVWKMSGFRRKHVNTSLTTDQFTLLKVQLLLARGNLTTVAETKYSFLCFCLFSMGLVTHLVCLQGFALHVEVPDFSSQVVSGEQVATTMAELDVRH